MPLQVRATISHRCQNGGEGGGGQATSLLCGTCCFLRTFTLNPCADMLATLPGKEILRMQNSMQPAKEYVLNPLT